MTGRQTDFNPTDDYIARFMGEDPLPPAQSESSTPQDRTASPLGSADSPWDVPTSATNPVPPNAFPPATPTSPPPSEPVPESAEARSPQDRFPFTQDDPPEYAGSPAMQDAMDANSLNTPTESAAMQDAIDANPRDPDRAESLAADPTFPAAPDVPGGDPTFPAASDVPGSDPTSATPSQPKMQSTDLTLPPAVPFAPSMVDEEAIAPGATDSTPAEPPAAPSRQELLQQLTRYQQQYGEDATQQLLSQVLIDFERRYGVSGTRELLLNVIEDLELQQGPAAAASVVSNLPEMEGEPPVQPIYPTAVVDFPDPQAQPAQPPPPVVERDLRSVPSPTATGNSTRQNLINLLPLALVAAIAGTALAFTLLNRGQSRSEATQMAQVQPASTGDADVAAQGAIAGWDDMSTQVSQVLDQTSGSPSSPTNPQPAPEVIEPLPPPLPDIEPEEPLEPPYDPSIPNPNLSPSPTPAPTFFPNTPYPPPATPLPGTQLW